MPFTDELLEAARPIWDAQLNHPFVRGIADGTLDEARFRRWLSQDYRYLSEFSRVFALAAARADTLSAMSWYARVLDLTLNTEMDLHRRYAARFGLKPDDLEATPMWPTTRAYTDFLIRTAATGDLADLVAALLPCAWGYVYLARQLATADSSPAGERYAEFITQYASEEFYEAADWLKGEMNRLAASAGEDKRQHLVAIFVLSSRYEWQFWEMCWQGEEWPV